MTPFEAATHADPYDYYARLRRHSELVFDADLGLWIASGARVVEAILEKVTNISMGTELDNVTAIEDIAAYATDAPTAILALQGQD